MIKKFLSLFEQQVSERPTEAHTLELAVAALMFEVVRADVDKDPAEYEAVKSLLSTSFSLTADELKDLMEDGESNADSAVDLVQFTRVINAHYDGEQRADLVFRLWSIAFADNQLDKYEEHAIRRISELLHVPHSRFVQAKLNASQ